MCSLCNNHDECLELFSCEFAGFLWCQCLRKWNVNWAAPKDTMQFFESWLEIVLRRDSRKAWWIAFFVVIWTVWKCLNKCTFEQKVITKKEALGMAGSYFK